jgi:hypothetical protein
MTLSLMPKDLPLPYDADRGEFNGSTGQPISQAGPDGITAYDPWTHANLAKMADHSQPELGEYGEPAYSQSSDTTGEWGGMPSPVRYFSDQGGYVLQIRRLVHPWDTSSYSTGRFYGPQQTAWEYSYVEPTDDYWSVILGA